MLSGLRTRVILIQSTVIAAALLLMGMVLYQIQKNDIIRQFVDNAQMTERLVRNQMQGNGLDLRKIALAVRQASVSPQFSSIQTVSTGDRQTIAKITQSLPPAFSEKAQALLTACKPGFMNMANMRLISVAPVSVSHGTCINLAIVSNRVYLTRRLFLLMEVLGVYMLFNFIILTIIAWFIIDRYTVMPLRRIEQAVEGVSGGDYPQMKEMPEAKELHRIVKAFNTMTTAIQMKEQRLKNTIQELKGMQALIIQREKLASLGSFVSAISHEIGNPLSAIISLLESAKTGISSGQKGADHEPGRMKDARQADMIGRSLNEAYRIDALIKQLLSYVRQKPPVFLDVDIKALCDDVLVSAGTARNLKDAGVSLDGVSGIVWKTDYEKLRQALLNLVTNAIDAMQGRGRLAIKAAVNSGQLILEVADTGVGIEKAHLEKIFDPFFTTKGSGKGTGLGLAIVKNIVQELHGEISVSSKKGEGAVFTIKLPFVPIANLHQG